MVYTCSPWRHHGLGSPSTSMTLGGSWMGFWSGRVHPLTLPGRRKNGCSAVVFGLLWCIFMTVFKQTCSGFTVLPDDSGAIGPQQNTQPSVERSRPTIAVQERLAPTQLDSVTAASSQREETRVDEPWGFARRTRARRCWATNLWFRIMPIWSRVWLWSSSSAWCSRYCVC